MEFYKIAMKLESAEEGVERQAENIVVEHEPVEVEMQALVSEKKKSAVEQGPDQSERQAPVKKKSGGYVAFEVISINLLRKRIECSRCKEVRPGGGKGIVQVNSDYKAF